MVNPRVRLIYKITSQSYLSWLKRSQKCICAYFITHIHSKEKENTIYFINYSYNFQYNILPFLQQIYTEL